MKKSSLSAALSCAALLTICQSNIAYSVEPMSESDMGNISAESGNVLNIMGSPASGGAGNVQPGDKQLEAANDQAMASVNYIEADQILEPRADSSLTPSSINAKDSISTFKISERGSAGNGQTILYYDESANSTSSSYSNNTLTINQNVQVQQVQINQVRHSAMDAPRGDYSFGAIQVNSAVSISER
ncbi:hypothetical protein [Alkalimarinus coralli]|uniref:hypothetical protein n=1 Tax=Alkalimarinus coralli TaxID=2935863 RepID=UPI00202AE6B7|nr:hypothetical protein [Alkalimarinus coralli]